MDYYLPPGVCPVQQAEKHVGCVGLTLHMFVKCSLSARPAGDRSLVVIKLLIYEHRGGRKSSNAHIRLITSDQAAGGKRVVGEIDPRRNGCYGYPDQTNRSP